MGGKNNDVVVEDKRVCELVVVEGKNLHGVMVVEEE